VLLGDGAGSFNSPLSFGVANLPDSVTMADFDGDGKPDIATADANPGQVSVFAQHFQ
jgi:FG-GAP repeat.